jgi:hypothetical protein
LNDGYNLTKEDRQNGGITMIALGILVVGCLMAYLLVRWIRSLDQKAWERFAKQYPSLCVSGNYKKIDYGTLVHVPTGDKFYVAGWNGNNWVFCVPYSLYYLSDDNKHMLDCFLSQIWEEALKQEEPQKLQQLCKDKAAAEQRYS